jgi:hypothetical protein
VCRGQVSGEWLLLSLYVWLFVAPEKLTLSPTRERGERDGRQNLSTPFGDAETLAEGVENYANGPRETESNCEVRGCELSLFSGLGCFFA